MSRISTVSPVIGAAAVVGALISGFRTVPTTHVLCSVAKPNTIGPNSQPGASREGLPDFILSVHITCDAESGRHCLQDELRFDFPTWNTSAMAPSVKYAEDLKGAVDQPTKLAKRDQSGREIYEVAIRVRLTDRDFVDIVTPINGMIDVKDVHLNTYRNDDLLASKFKCDPDHDAQRITCDEKVGLIDRLALLAFLKG